MLEGTTPFLEIDRYSPAVRGTSEKLTRLLGPDACDLGTLARLASASAEVLTHVTNAGSPNKV
jgi:hypothetical protein